MKILARSALMILALGCTVFGEQLAPMTLDAVTSDIMEKGGDASLDQTECCPVSDDDAAPPSAPRLGQAAGILRELLNISTISRYQLLLVCRPG
jgi:hypothetical protein